MPLISSILALVLAAFFGALAMALDSTPGRNPGRNPVARESEAHPLSEKRVANDGQPPQEHSERNWLRRKIQIFYRHSQERRAYKKQRSPADRANDRTVAATWAIVVITVFNPIVGVMTYLILRGQLDEAQAARRPWIAVEVTIANNINLSAGWGIIPIDFTVRNVGQTPALEVRVSAWAFPEHLFSENFDAFQRKNCREFSERPAADLEERWTVFPSDKFLWDKRGVGYMPPSYTPQQLIAVTSVSPDKKRSAMITFAGCVDYVSPSDRKHHQTAFAYHAFQLVQSLGQTALAGIDVDSIVPKADVFLEESPSAPDLTN